MADDLNLEKTEQDEASYTKENALKANSPPLSLNEEKIDNIQNTYSLNIPNENQNSSSKPILNALPPISYDTEDIPEENSPDNTSNFTDEKFFEQNIPFDIENLLKSFSGNFQNSSTNSVPNENTFNNQTANNEESVPNQNPPNNNFLGGIFGNLLGGTGNLSAKMSNLKTEDMILIGLFFFLMQEKEKNTELLIALALLFFMGLE